MDNKAFPNSKGEDTMGKRVTKISQSNQRQKAWDAALKDFYFLSRLRGKVLLQ